MFVMERWLALCKKATIHQVTTMLATSVNVLFPGYNDLLTTDTGDLSLLIITQAQGVRSSVRWLKVVMTWK